MRARPARRAFLALLILLYGSLASAETGWAVSELVTVPRTDYPVTGRPPQPCLSEEEAARLRLDPVHRFQVSFARWLERTFDLVTRLQEHVNCASACAAIPLDAYLVTDLRGYARPLPDGPFSGGGPWPYAGHAIWEAEIDSSQVVGGERLVCATLRNETSDFGFEGYFIIYYEH